ncbi:single-stranded DNA-binding protein [Pseudoxanthomonas putridarboris]|uniref:Single-stranded DNA-binding protein n=1 Tax=Pseudoxanthomonas putridarboris TaxID=752605 RepID=A0ABU9J0H6_9GAMM
MNCILIKSGTSTPRSIKRKDGTQVIFNEQKAAIEKGEDFPVPFTISLGDGQPPYPPGRYLLDVSSLEVGDFDALKVSRRIALVPVPAK